MSHLFSPLAIRGVTLKNRVMVSPMNQYSSRDGFAGDWHLGHLAQFATGGAGLVCMEATKVERRGLGSVGDTGLWKDEHIAPIRRIAAFLREQGAVSGIQLSHAGRKAGTKRPWEGFGTLDRSGKIEGQDPWPMIAPSPIAYLDGWPTPREMTQDDIDAVVEAFAQAARRAHAAGLDVIELHGGHGYLIHQFLSPASNRRTDRYGGSLDNRMRFALEVTAAVRREWPPEKPLFFRISAVDEGGWSLDDSVVLAQALKPAGIDAIDCSSAGINVRSVTLGGAGKMLGFQVPYAERIRREAGILTIAVGFIVKPEQAEEIVASGQADIVALAREMLFDPFWTAHAAAALGVDPEFRNLPAQYGWWLNRRAKAGYGE
jgi:2,4-dienoyl-CoA reductase-like NADH-dependent reductase (Old Yellow Enzyme family)